jgi:cathepsin F
MRTIALALAALKACAQDNEAQDRLHFEDFKQTYGRTYESVDQEEYRFGIFRATLRRIAQNNADPEDGAEYGVTRWSDRTSNELRTRCGGSCVGSNCTRVTARRGVTAKAHAWDGTCYVKPRFPEMCDVVPDELDWTTMGAVTKIKDQGECGNCFTFGATCDMEAAWFLAGHDMVSLSEQQLTSCDSVGGDGGCDGGDTNLDTDKYVSKHGLNSEKNYPYSSKSYKKGKSGTCDKNLEASPVATFTDGYQISGGVRDCDWCNKQPIDEDVMKKHLATAGPFTIAINALFMDSYKKGIASPNKELCCGLAMCLDHQVAVVGYGSENGVDYWKIRNS